MPYILVVDNDMRLNVGSSSKIRVMIMVRIMVRVGVSKFTVDILDVHAKKVAGALWLRWVWYATRCQRYFQCRMAEFSIHNNLQ